MTRNMLNILALIHFGVDPLNNTYPARAGARRLVIRKLMDLYAIEKWRGRLVLTGYGRKALEGAK